MLDFFIGFIMVRYIVLLSISLDTISIDIKREKSKEKISIKANQKSRITKFASHKDSLQINIDKTKNKKTKKKAKTNILFLSISL